MFVEMADLFPILSTGHSGLDDSPNLQIALAAARAVHNDIATNRALPVVDADLQKAYATTQQGFSPASDFDSAYAAYLSAKRDRDNYAAILARGYNPTAAGSAGAAFESATQALQRSNAAIAAQLQNTPNNYVTDSGDLASAASTINSRLDGILSKARALGGLYSDLAGASSTSYVRIAAVASIFNPIGAGVYIGSAIFTSLALGDAQQQAVGQILDMLISIVNDESAAHNAGAITDEEHAWLTDRERSLQSYIAAKGRQQWKESETFRKGVTKTGGYYNAIVPGPIRDALDRLLGGSGGSTAGVESGEDVKSKEEAEKDIEKAKKCLEDPITCAGPIGYASVGAIGAGAIGGLLGLVKSESAVGAVIGLLSGAILGGAAGYYIAPIFLSDSGKPST